MMQTTQYLSTPFPEAADLADVPKNMRDIAVNWENAWGGVWLDWLPVVTQFELGEPAYLGIATTTVAKVRKVGKMVNIYARIDIAAGTGHNGYPQVYLPYPVADIAAPMGVQTSFFSASSQGLHTAEASTFSSLLTNTSVVEIYSASAARVAGDFIALLLEYETV
jgi:hypothetical protein